MFAGFCKCFCQSQFQAINVRLLDRELERGLHNQLSGTGASWLQCTTVWGPSLLTCFTWKRDTLSSDFSSFSQVSITNS